MVARRQRFSQRVRRREYGNVSSPLTLIKTGRDFAFYVVASTSGVEDYLTGDETRTYWWGQAAAAVGLAGEVQAEALEALLVGVDPQAIAEGRNDGETVAQPEPDDARVGVVDSAAQVGADAVGGVRCVHPAADRGGDAGRHRRVPGRVRAGRRVVPPGPERRPAVGVVGADRRTGAADHIERQRPPAARARRVRQPDARRRGRPVAGHRVPPPLRREAPSDDPVGPPVPDRDGGPSRSRVGQAQRPGRAGDRRRTRRAASPLVETGESDRRQDGRVEG